MLFAIVNFILQFYSVESNEANDILTIKTLENMTILFNDNAKANTSARVRNIQILESNGFKESGAVSRSGEMYMVELKTKVQLVFGVRCNVAGKRNKYFSLKKDFTSAKEAIAFFKKLKLAK